MRYLKTTFTLFSALVSLNAYAQLQGAVSFDANVIAEPKEVIQAESDTVVQKTEETKETENKFDNQAYLKDQMEKTSVFDNPRFAKKAYGALQGMQQSIEKEQKAVVDKKTFKTAEEKAAFEQELKDKDLINFKDFDDDSKTVNTQINENPVAKVQEMANNISYISPEKLSDDDSKAIRDQADAIFEAREGISTEEYMRLYEQQLEDETTDVLPAGELDKKTRITKGASIEVKKIDDRSAVIQQK